MANLAAGGLRSAPRDLAEVVRSGERELKSMSPHRTWRVFSNTRSPQRPRRPGTGSTLHEAVLRPHLTPRM